MTGAYLIVNLVTGKVYVGGTAQSFRRRWKGHKNNSRNPHLKSSIKKYGIENFYFGVLEYCKPEKCVEHEQYWIDFFKDWLGWDMMYNMSPTAGSCLGVRGQTPWNKGKKGVQTAWNKGKKMSEEFCKKNSEVHIGIKQSEETKSRRSESMKGNTNCLGRKLSEEHKRNISEALKGHKAWNKGKNLSEETCIKMSVSKKGHKVSEEARAKISAAHKGKKRQPLSLAHRQKISKSVKAYWSLRKDVSSAPEKRS